MSTETTWIKKLLRKAVEIPSMPEMPDRRRELNETLLAGKGHRLRPDVMLVAGPGLLAGRMAPKPLIRIAEDDVTVGRPDNPIHLLGGGGLHIPCSGAVICVVVHDTHGGRAGITIMGTADTGEAGIAEAHIHHSHFAGRGIGVNGGHTVTVHSCYAHGEPPLVEARPSILNPEMEITLFQCKATNRLVVASKWCTVHATGCLAGSRRPIRISKDKATSSL
jgi:hypothetical protein